METILVTGGAGYIGSHTVKELIDDGYKVVVVDNLSKGHKKAVDKKARFVLLDLADKSALDKLFSNNKIDAVVHFAGSIEAGLSMTEPMLFLQNNVVNGLNLLEAMKKYGVKNIIFSSTAAVYGDPVKNPIKENDRLLPTNYYGLSKLFFEQHLDYYRRRNILNYVALRYFNAAGADKNSKIGQDYSPDSHLISRMLKTILGKYKILEIFGTDYKTKDGTCVRDYIHVSDLASAHVLALKWLLKNRKSDVFNLGNGKGFTVNEVISTAERVTGKKVPVKKSARRAGDPVTLIADSAKAKKILKWRPKSSSLKDIVGSAWNWHSSHPDGYGS
jgi:UDP-glucose 4-epimerase